MSKITNLVYDYKNVYDFVRHPGKDFKGSLQNTDSVCWDLHPSWMTKFEKPPAAQKIKKAVTRWAYLSRDKNQIKLRPGAP